MATTFPENDVEVLQRYLPDDLHGALQRTRAELARTHEITNVVNVATFETFDGPLTPDERASQARAHEVNEARGKVLEAFDRALLGMPEKPPAMVRFDTITDDLARHELPGALAGLAIFDSEAPPAGGLQLDALTLATAFSSDPIPYLVSIVTKVITTPTGTHEVRVRQPFTLRGYRAADRLSPAHGDQLFTLLSFLSATPERTFRLTVMRGEAHVGLGSFEEAIAEFAKLLPATGGGGGGTHGGVGGGVIVGHLSDVIVHGTLTSATTTTPPPPAAGHSVTIRGGDFHLDLDDLVLTDITIDTTPTPREKFAALRIGFAHLGRGDALFRHTRHPEGATRDAIRAAYNAAIQIVGTRQIAPENPLRQQVEQYGALQKAKLDGGMNILGYRDGYLPILRPATLQALAERRIQAASEAAQKFEGFKARADQIQDQLADLDFQTDVKQIELAISDEQIAKAEDQVEIADRQIEHIGDQLDALDLQTLVGIGGALLQGGAAGFLAGSPGGPSSGPSVIGTSLPGVAGAVSGLASTLAGYSARKDELKFQQEFAKLQAGIARRDLTIAKLGKKIAEITLDFLGEKIQRIKSRELGPDLYYAAAEAFRALALRNLDAAILWSYLFERSVAFLRLEPELRAIQFDYADGPGGLLTAPDRLKADLQDVAEHNLPITKFQFLTERYSLRALYPIEFNRFLQTGGMDFTISLYDLNKRRPGVYRQRIKRVSVELQHPPLSGFTGRIRHRGSFTLRDKDSTPAPSTGQFLPTGQVLADALAAMGEGASQGLPVGGVIPFLLDVDTLELSPDAVPPDLGDPAPEALMPIEGYGPAGDWTLEVENVDLRFITDALLRITYVIPESDEPLSVKVKGLIAAYEQELLQGDALDLITPFSLRQRFRDAYDRLATGTAQFILGRNDFPAGISLEVSKPGTAFTLQRTTGADGFSEDVTAEIPVLPPTDRMPVQGTYALRLTDPTRFAALGELLVFFIYEFQEV